MWRMRIHSRSIRATWYGDGTINCSQWNQDRSSFKEWWSSISKFCITTIRRNRIRFVVKIHIILAQGEWSSAKEAKTIFNTCNKRQRQTFCNMVNVYVFNIASICIHGKNYSDIWHSIKKQKISQWKRCSTYLKNWCPNNQMRSMEKTINWEDSSWKYLSLIGDEQVISLQRTKVYVFSDSVLYLGKMNEHPQSNGAWEDKCGWFRSSPEYRNFDRIDCELMEFEWNIFPGFNTLRLSQEVKQLLLRLGETPENFTGRIVFLSIFNDISWRSRDNEKECKSNAQLVSLCAKRFEIGQWSFIGPGSEKKWYSISEDSPQGIWDNLAEKMLLEFAESGCPTFRAATPLSRGHLRARTWKTVDSLCGRPGNEWDYFSHNCFCKPAQSLRSSRRDLWKIGIPSRKNWATCCDDAINRAQCDQDRSFFGKRRLQRINIFHSNNTKNELRSHHDKRNWVNSARMQDFWVLWRMDSTSWRKTLEISHNLIQWPVVNTLFHEKKHHNRKDGSEGTPKLGLYWKLQPVTWTVNMELGSEVCLWAETILTSGSEFLMDQISLWWTRTTTIQKFLKISSKNMRYYWMRKIL